MNLVNFKHNDLHSSNILLVKRQKSRLRCYKVYDPKTKKSKVFWVPNVGWDVRIIDMDRAWKGKGEYSGTRKQFNVKIDNPVLKQARFNVSFGQSQRKNHRYDIFRILMNVYNKPGTPGHIRNFVSSIIHKSILSKTHNRIEVLSNSYIMNKQKGMNFISTDSDVLSPMTIMLTHPFFDELTELKEQIGVNKNNPLYPGLYSTEYIYKRFPVRNTVYNVRNVNSKQVKKEK